MAEGDATVYNNYFELLLQGGCNLTSDTMQVALFGSGYSFSRTGSPGYASVSANEISTTNYTAKGKTLGTKTIVQNDTAHNAKFDAADVTWTSLGTTTIAHAILFDDTVTTPVADPLLVRWEISTNSNGGNYTLQWHTNGIIVVS